jgi:hypothetical protein
MKIIVLVFLALTLFGCGIPKEEYDNVVSENQELKEKILQLENEIKTLKETDQYYYQSGSDEFSNKNYKEVIEWMNNLKLKFPNSSLIDSANKLTKDANNELALIYQKEKKELDNLIQKTGKIDIEAVISTLESYIRENHSDDLIKIATGKLSSYKTEFEKVRVEREVENKTGMRLVDYSTGWNFKGSLGNRFLTPTLNLKFKNISKNPVKELIVKVSFIDASKNEVFDETMNYTIGSIDTPLQPDYTKTAYINGSVGYKTFYGESLLPSLRADIYINDLLYKNISVAKKIRE